MKRKSTVDMEIAVALKAVRTVIRLKHSEAADREINDVLPDVEAQMRDAAAAGQPYKLDLAELLR